MRSLFEDDVMRVDYDESSNELVVVAKLSDQQDNVLYVTANNAGGLSLVAPMSKWHPDVINNSGGFRLWLN